MIVYRIQFTNFEGNLVEILITDTTTSGGIVYTDLVGLGFSRKTVNNAEDAFRPIRALEAIIKFASTTTENISTFVDGDDNRYKVEATVLGVNIFTGFLVTNDLSQPYFDDPNEVTLTATDGLGGLKDVSFVDVLGFNPVGYHNLAEFVAIALYQTGLQLISYISCNIYEEISSSTMIFDSCFLQSKTFEQEIGVSENCYTVIEKILSALGCFVQQRNGAWYITSVDEMEDGINTYHLFSQYGIIIPEIITPNPIEANYIINIGSAETVKFIQEDQSLGLRRADNFARLDYHYDFPQEIIDNINFERGAANLVVSPPAGYDAFELDDWTTERNFPSSGTPLIHPLILRKFDGAYEKERFASIPGTSTGGNTEYIQSHAIPIIIKDKFSVSFDFRFPTNFSGSGTATDLIGYVYLKSGGTTYSLQNNGKWILGTGFTLTHQWLRTADEREWMTVSVEADPAPISGDVYVCLLKSSLFGNTTDTYFSNLSFDYMPYINGNYKKYSGQYNKEYLNINKKPNLTDEVFITDSPRPLFKGALFISPDFLMVSRFYNLFHTPTPTDPTDYYNMGKMQAIIYWNQYRRVMRRLEGSVHGLENIPDCTWKYQFTDSNINADNKIFQCLWFDQDFYKCEWKAGFVEVFDSVVGKDYSGNFLFKYIE